MSQYFPKSYEPFCGGINVKVDLSNYAVKANIKNISYVHTSSFALKTNLAILKTEVDKLHIDKLVPVPADLRNLSDDVKNHVVKKDVYDKLVAKVNSIDTSVVVSKTENDTNKSELENKIPDTSGLVKKTDFDSKISEIESKAALTTVENKIPNVSGLATKTELAAVENKIPDISNFVTKTTPTNLSNTVPDISTLNKKSDYDAKIAEIESKYVSNTRFGSKLAQANVITKRNFHAKINEHENNIKKLQAI